MSKRTYVASMLAMGAVAALALSHFSLPARAQSSTPAPVKLETFKDCETCPQMVSLPAGEFMMGRPEKSAKCEPASKFENPDNLGQDNELPHHKVTIGYKFAIGKFEVTTAEWAACIADGVCRQIPAWRLTGGIANMYNDGLVPEFVITPQVPAPASWTEITTQYLPWLEKKTGKKYRLPTEAEWEYAARGGTTTPFSSGCYADGSQTKESLVWFGKRVMPSEVGKGKPNPFGLYDMQANFNELVQDCYHVNYQGAPTDGSAWTEPCTKSATDSVRVMRSASNGSFWLALRSAARDQIQASVMGPWVGFRVALTQ